MLTLPESRPLLLGHRGARPVRRLPAHLRSLFPAENTREAFELSLSQGCDGFEFDVRHTRDQRHILCHDQRFLGRTIAESEYSALARRLRTGRHRRPELLCLEEVLADFGQRAFLDIELKAAGQEFAVAQALKARSPGRGYIVTSFLPEVLLRLHELDPGIPLGFLASARRAAERWTELPVAVFVPHYSLVSKLLIQEAHQRSIRLFAWTVNHERDLLRLAHWGVDGLISDDPALLGRLFAQQQEPGSM